MHRRTVYYAYSSTCEEGEGLITQWRGAIGKCLPTPGRSKRRKKANRQSKSAADVWKKIEKGGKRKNHQKTSSYYYLTS